MSDISYDLVIVGGSLGGCAAALGAAQMGASVCLIESTGWLGGQYTAQGVTKPDENRYTETVGSTQSYRAFLHAVRLYYRNNYRLSQSGANQPEFNPGGSYPGFAMEPRVGHTILGLQLATLPNVHVRLQTQVTSVQVVDNEITSIEAVDATGNSTNYLATFFLDATDLGDLLPLCGDQGTDWVLGAESQADTGEPDAPAEAHPEWIQPITIPFALERRPMGEDNTITPPADYEQLKAEQGYTILDGYINSMFIPGRDMWSYRQFIAAVNFADPAFPYDLTMINTGSNDYQAATIPSGSTENDAAIIARARQAALGYLYWLQTECPHDEDSTRKGYAQLRLRPDLFGTPDGTAVMPYIRESRRIKAIKTIVQQEIDADYNPGPRATLYRDTCGIGWYSMDVHALASVGMAGVYKSTKPYQIPVSALIPQRITNLLAACKNPGVTHLTNGAYRLHPIEWNIGEAAGALAAFCLQRNVTPSAVPATSDLLRDYQHFLLSMGIPLFWWSDITVDSPYFAAVHLLGINSIVTGYEDMSFRPNNLLTDQERKYISESVGTVLNWPSGTMTRGQAALWLVQTLQL